MAVGHKPDPVSYTSHLHWPLAHAAAKTVGRDHTHTHTERVGIKRQESREKRGPPHKMKRDVPLWSSEPVRPAGAFNKSKQGHKVGAEKNRPGEEPL